MSNHDDQIGDDLFASVLGGSVELLRALRGAMMILDDQLIWSETQYPDTGNWRITVSMDGLSFYGSDGHLLSKHRDEGRLAAFQNLMSMVTEDAVLKREPA